MAASGASPAAVLAGDWTDEDVARMPPKANARRLGRRRKGVAWEGKAGNLRRQRAEKRAGPGRRVVSDIGPDEGGEGEGEGEGEVEEEQQPFAEESEH